jgi:hypothetical protein
MAGPGARVAPVKRLGAVLAAVVAALVGAAGQGARPVAAAPAAHLAVLPAAGPPGTTVRLDGTVASAALRRATAVVCWGGCGSGGVQEELPVDWSGERFEIEAQAPAFAWSAAAWPGTVPRGPLAVAVACLTAHPPACLAAPNAEGTFEVTRTPASVSWASASRRLPDRGWRPLPPETDFPGFSLATGGAPRVARCVAGPGGGTPVLLVSPDLGRTWTSVPLPAHELGEQADGQIGCRALALDPTDPSTFYVAGAGDPGTAVLTFASPVPLYTTDDGATWNLVPVPPGFVSTWGWSGFTASSRGVVSWYSRAFFGGPLSPALFAEEVALSGGSLWVPIPLICPATGPCLWHLAGLNPDVNGGPSLVGVVWSSDHGRTWAWARFAGMPLSGGQPVLAGNAVLWPEAVAWPVGTEGTPGGGLLAPLLASTDGGRSWTWVTLPRPPGGWSPGDLLRVLPDGRLLLEVWGGSPAGWLLPRGARAWCALRGPVPGDGRFLVAGGYLVWLTREGLADEPASALACAAGR